MIRIETPRLILRDHESGDLAPMHAILSDPAATWYIPSMFKEDMDETQEYLASALRDTDASPRLRYNLAIVTREGEYLGEVGMHYIDGTPEDNHCGLGYYIRPDRWNLGYATEAARAALGFIFANGARRVSAACLAENLGSRRVLEKCGMTQEGMLKAHTWHDGQWKDCAVYRLLKDEYDRRYTHV